MEDPSPADDMRTTLQDWPGEEIDARLSNKKLLVTKGIATSSY